MKKLILSLGMILTLSFGDTLEEGKTAYYKKDYATAIKIYEQLANQGNAEAQYEIGSMYQLGDGVQNDNKKANHWYEKAANQGHIDAQFYLGENYFSGYGIPKDFKKAIYWYEKAANLGRIDAQNKLGNIYNHIIAASRTSIPKDLKKAIYWHEKAAVQYDNNFYRIYGLNSMAELMEIYSSHDSEEKDLEKAFSLYEVHCNSYSRNDNINKSCEKMKKIAYKINNPEFEQAEKLAKKGKATDQYNLGQLYYKEKNIKEALYWFEQAANQGYAKAQFNMGVIYDKQKDTQKAFYWTEKAANQGLSVAQFNLGLTYLDDKNKSENPEKAFYWMEKAANQGDLDAMNYLGLMYKKGYGVNQNYTKASEWYKKACHKGNSNGCENYKKSLN